MRKIYYLFILSFLFTGEVFAQFPNPYCAVSFASGNEPISKVIFAGINNSSSPNVTGAIGHEDFTAVAGGSVMRGQTYTMTVEGNTDGNYTSGIVAFFDWNNNNVFTDAGESYTIGTITNSTGADGMQAIGSVSVPFTASLGSVRMRVIKKYNAYALSCNTAGYGQAEDYVVTVTAAYTNDAALLGAYTVGKNMTGQPTVITARVRNAGSTTLTNLPVTLNVTGAKVYTNTKTITTLNSGDSATVTFDAYTTWNTGSNTITVSLPADNLASNNTITITQPITSNTLSTAFGTTPSGGVGNSSAAIDIATKFKNTGTKTIDQVLTYFPATSTGQPFTVSIYDATGAGGTPGAAALWTSASQTTSGANITVAVPSISVTGDFFVVLSQTGTTNAGFGYEAESPLRPGFFYFKTTGAWVDLADASTNNFKMMLDVRFNSGLPVELLSFAGYGDGRTNTLKWSTATESNNKGFELQRSADGNNFSTISFVATKAEGGNSTSLLNYSFVDEKPFAGINYYRLKQVDNDGKYSYSKIIDLKSKVSEISLSSYPNPVRDVLNVKLSSPSNEKLTIVVTDITGKVVMTKSTTAVAGDNNEQLNVAKLSPGSYMIKAICANGCETSAQRFVKQ